MRYVQRSGCLEDARPCFSHCFRIKAMEVEWQRKPTNSVSALCSEECNVEKHGIVFP